MTGPGEVTVTLTCDSGDVTEDDNTATETDDAEFTVDGFTPGDTCDASENQPPDGYTKNESDCEDLVLGTDTSCQIENTLNTASFTVNKSYVPSGPTDAVDVELNCSDADFDQSGSASPSTSEVFNLEGFNNGMTCSVTETVPSGYSGGLRRLHRCDDQHRRQPRLRHHEYDDDVDHGR